MKCANIHRIVHNRIAQHIPTSSSSNNNTTITTNTTTNTNTTNTTSKSNRSSSRSRCANHSFVLDAKAKKTEASYSP